MSPDGLVMPDFSGALPGRGAWVSAGRKPIEKAMASGAFARAFRQKVAAADELPGMVEAGLCKAALSSLGMARRAGQVVTGFEKTRSMLKSGKADAFVFASDAGADAKKKAAALRGATRLIEVFTRNEIAAALGQEDVVYCAMISGPHSARFFEAVDKLAGFRAEAP